MKQKNAVQELMEDIIKDDADQGDIEEYCQGQKTYHEILVSIV